MYSKGKTVRNPTVSVMKGIAIGSVVWGHVFVNTTTETFVEQYHLAVFFFVAGYLFKTIYLDSFRTFLWRRIKSLYIPYALFSLLIIALHNVFYAICITKEYAGMKQLLMMAYLSCVKLLVGHEELLGTLWFCPALLITSLVSFVCLWSIRSVEHWDTWSICIIGGLTFIAKICLSFDIKSPFQIWETLPLCSVFISGHFFKKHENFFNIERIRLFVVISAFLALLAALYTRSFASLQPWKITEEKMSIVIIIATLCSMLIYYISQRICNVRVLRTIIGYLGDHSFCIMACHFLAFRMVNYVYCLSNGYSYDYVSVHPHIPFPNWYWSILCFVWGCLCPLALFNLWNNFKKYLSCAIR